MVKSVYQDKRKGLRKMIGVIDYGAGNLQSVVKALDFIGCKSFITDKRDELIKADRYNNKVRTMIQRSKR